MTGELKKMKIEAFDSLEYTNQVGSFSLMFNPSTYQQKYEIEYEDAQGQGTSGSAQTFARIKPQEDSFEFVFDGTGVSSEKADVSDLIEEFLDLTARNNGDIHRPNYLQISWGNLISRCVLKSANVTYNLFKADGFPLRAKVNATFSENIDDTRRVAEEGNSSPDLTHYRTVVKGDSLPLLAFRIYGDPAYYLEVARVNGLDDFRVLVPGTKLRFPPLDQRAS